MTWQRLSARSKENQPEVLYEGVPEHLTASVVYWIQGEFGYRSQGGMRTQTMHSVAMAARLPIPYGRRDRDLQGNIIDLCVKDGDVFLDTIDAVLHVRGGGSELGKLLDLGGSAWRVSDDGRQLQRRVSEAGQRAYDETQTASDTAANELSEAWIAAFGRQLNPSDAWDHAIKAVEAILIPVVVPNQSKPQLGHVIGQLRNQPDRWKFILPGSSGDHGPQPLSATLDVIWPNPDRHANDAARRPTQAEAESVVHAAVMLVQWSRQPGFLELR